MKSNLARAADAQNHQRAPHRARETLPRPADGINEARAYLHAVRPERAADLGEVAVEVKAAIDEAAARATMTEADRRAGLEAARVIRDLAKKYGSDAQHSIQPLIDYWTRGNGRPREAKAAFARAMLCWGAMELGSSGEVQITASELLAAAVIARVQQPTEGDALRQWSELHKKYLPADSQRLAHEGRCAKATPRPLRVGCGTIWGLGETRKDRRISILELPARALP